MSGSTTTCQQVIEKSKYIILVVCSCGTESYWVLCYSDSDSFSKKEPLYFFNDAFSLTLSSEPLYERRDQVAHQKRGININMVYCRLSDD